MFIVRKISLDIDEIRKSKSFNRLTKKINTLLDLIQTEIKENNISNKAIEIIYD